MSLESINKVRQDIRNIAIVAHVDHGKTSLVDVLLRQSGAFRMNQQVPERVMDSNDLERERGITILSKNTSVRYNGVKINIIDTPGHADFGGEVERILGMVDGILLVVDAFEGPMAQTRYVLQKAFKSGLKAVVVINKIDRNDARIEEVLNEVIDLFISLEASDLQLDFPVVYASARQGVASMQITEEGCSFTPLLETIIRTIPAPGGDIDLPLQLGVNTLDYDDYVGRLIVGKLVRGRIYSGQQVSIVKRDGSVGRGRISRLYTFNGLQRDEAEEALAGDIVAVAGISDITIGETICDVDAPEALPIPEVDEPTLAMTFMVNNSPFAGRDGQYVTSRHLRDRLLREAERNVSLRVNDTDSPDAMDVSGRGELHLSILVETMRREGYELMLSKPRVITRTIAGVLQEPYEYLTLNLPQIHMGAVMELLGPRKAEMQNMQQDENDQVRLEFIIPARGLIGFRSDYLTLTKGYGIMSHVFYAYRQHSGEIPGRSRGVLVAWEDGVTTTYALHALQERGILFVNPSVEVYRGMIVGINSKEGDIDVNVCRKKHVTNIRSAAADESLRLEPPRILTLEQAMEFIEDDEFVEVTPRYIRLRKRYLDHTVRYRMQQNSL